MEIVKLLMPASCSFASLLGHETFSTQSGPDAMEKGMSEQDILRDTLEKMGEFGSGNKHLLIVSQFKMNAYPAEIGCHENRERPWQPGDWIIHFAV